MSMQLSNQCSQSETDAELSANLLSMKKFVFINILILSVCAGAMAQAGGTAANYTRPDADKRFKRFVNDTVGPFAWVGVGASAAFSTAADTPKEWGRTTEGFGRRFASNFGKTVIRNTVIYGMDEAFKLDSHYYRSTKRDAGSRVKNAFLSTVTARTAKGKRTIGLPRIIGTYSANMIATQVWYPARYDWKEGVKTGSISLGVNALFNLVKEFAFKK